MQFAHKLVLTMYRGIAVLGLYAILIGVIAYVSVLGFYEVSTSWIAPTVISPNDIQGLAVADRVVTSGDTLIQLKVDRERQLSNLVSFQTERKELSSLRLILSGAMHQTRKQDLAIAAEMDSLQPQKQADQTRTADLVADDSLMEARIQKDLNAGLITKTEAAETEAQLNSVKNGLTDGRISEVALRDSVQTRRSVNSALVEGLAKQAEIHSKLAELDAQIASAQNQISADDAEIKLINHTVDLALETPYFIAAKSGQSIDLAFVPYENQRAVKVEAPVYDCYLSYMICRQVGTVSRIFGNEEHAQNPVFKSEMRGFLVQLTLSDRFVVRSKTLFVGGKPLGI
jgi:hypothetical protein